MSNVIAIRETETEKRWAAYMAAKAKADTTGRIEDGIAAGKAWQSFLELFMSEDKAHG